MVRTHLDESLNNGLAYLDSSNGTNAAGMNKFAKEIIRYFLGKRTSLAHLIEAAAAKLSLILLAKQ